MERIVADADARVARTTLKVCAALATKPPIRPELDLGALDLAERHLQKAGADRPEGFDVPGT